MDVRKMIDPINSREVLDEHISKYNWMFSNLKEAFENRDGDGILAKKRVYLFWRCQPQVLIVDDKPQLVVIPVVVALVLPPPPQDELVIRYLQPELKGIIPMKKTDSVPYISAEEWYTWSGVQHLKEGRVSKSINCFPYYFLPREEEMDSEVLIKYPDAERLIVCSFDWERNDLEEWTSMLIKDRMVPSNKKEAFKEFVQLKVQEAKKANLKAEKPREKVSEDLKKEIESAIQNIKLYKFYPVPTADTPDVSIHKIHYINSYFENAHEIF